MNMDVILELLDRPIAYHRIFAKMAGSVNAGVMLSQAFYWSRRLKQDRNGWFYKTRVEWEEETCLSRREQEVARKLLIKAGFWEEKLKGVPAQLHFRINFGAFYAKMIVCSKSSSLSMAETAQLDCTIQPNLDGCIRPSIMTESTSEITAKNNKSKETTSAPPKVASRIFKATWKPDGRSKKEKLDEIEPIKDYPSEDSFNLFLDFEECVKIIEYRPDLYTQLCDAKWHAWNKDSQKWFPISNWKKFVLGLESKIDEQFEF